MFFPQKNSTRLPNIIGYKEGNKTNNLHKKQRVRTLISADLKSTNFSELRPY
jgi:hypothetical protein